MELRLNFGLNFKGFVGVKKILQQLFVNNPKLTRIWTQAPEINLFIFFPSKSWNYILLELSQISHLRVVNAGNSPPIWINTKSCADLFCKGAL